MNGHINLSINFLVKIFREHISKSIDFTSSKGGISSIKGNIKRTSSSSHYRIFCGHKKGGISFFTQSHLISYLIFIGRSKCAIQKNLSTFFRKASLLHIQFIHCVIYGFNVKNLLLLAFPAHHIGRPGTFCGLDAIYTFYGRNIIRCQAHCAHNLDIHQAAFVIIGISGIAHIRRGSLNTGKEGHSKSHDQKNGDKPGFAFSDLHPEFFS